MISYAQNFEDVMLWRVFHDIGCGRYVDVGAFHPEIDSVTKWFYDQGWSGVNIEPVPESFALLAPARPRDRNLCVAAGATAGSAQMTVFPGSAGLSSLNPSSAAANSAMERNLVQVEVLPLRQILEPQLGEPIHFLKIDAEGSEHDALLGMDFTRFRPWVILVEATAPLVPTRNAELWEEILLRNDYHRVYFDGLNDFFLASEKMELASRFRVPPNVFDDFEFASTVSERQLRQALESSCAALRAEVATRNDDIAAVREAISVLENELVTARTELDAARTKITSSEVAFTNLSGDVAELAQALQTSREQVQQIMRSRSWRWLAPVRGVNLVLKTYRKRIIARRAFLGK
jgi:FkbM family methyltransferase